MNQPLLAYVSKHGHYNKFVALTCLWHQAYPHIDISVHASGVTRRFQQFVNFQPLDLYLHDSYGLCAMFVESEHVRIYGGLSVARIGAAH